MEKTFVNWMPASRVPSTMAAFHLGDGRYVIYNKYHIMTDPHKNKKLSFYATWSTCEVIYYIYCPDKLYSILPDVQP